MISTMSAGQKLASIRRTLHPSRRANTAPNTSLKSAGQARSSRLKGTPKERTAKGAIPSGSQTRTASDSAGNAAESETDAEDRKRLQLELAEAEADLIGDLTGRRKLRVHVVGDCASPESAEIVGAAMVRYEKKRGSKSWTYTHAWRDIPATSWKGARVIASCHKRSEVQEAIDRGYPVALTIEPVSSNKAFDVSHDEAGNPVNTFKVIPCPAQMRRPDGRRYSVCETCSICQNTDRLRRDRLVVGFQPDYGTGKRLLPLMK